jgi:hypothetical protein
MEEPAARKNDLTIIAAMAWQQLNSSGTIPFVKELR